MMEFELAMVNEPSGFELLRFDCTLTSAVTFSTICVSVFENVEADNMRNNLPFRFLC